MNRNDLEDYFRNNVFTKRNKERLPKLLKDDIVIGCVLVVLGLLFIFLPTIVSGYLGVIMGLLMVAYGLLTLWSYIAGKKQSLFAKFDLVKGIVFVVAGAAMVRYPLMLISIITAVIGAFFFLESVIKMRGMVAIPMKRTISWWITIVLSSIVALLGLFIGLFPLKGIETVMVFTGLILTFRGCQKFAEAWRIRHNL